MKVQMVRNKLGSNDGVTTQMYIEGDAYEVSEALGAVFLRDGDATAEGVAAEPEAFVVGDIYADEDGMLFVAGEVAGTVGLLPIEQLSDGERADLVTEGKLNADGTAIAAKAITAAPKNKAITKAPKNKAK